MEPAILSRFPASDVHSFPLDEQTVPLVRAPTLALLLSSVPHRCLSARPAAAGAWHHSSAFQRASGCAPTRGRKSSTRS